MAEKSTNRPSRAARPARGRRFGWKKAGLLALVLALVSAIVASIAVIVFYNRTTLPDPNKDFTTNTTFLYYEDGSTKLGSYAVQNRQSLTYAQMPATVKDAVIAAENRTFLTDRGISPTGIVRSAWTIARGGEVQGGSTITQQYIKVLYLSQDRTMTRKLRELALAVKMGKQLPKEQILQGYLNTVYFGRGAYGVQAASRSYFNTDAAKLTTPQAAVLASVLNNPSIFDPSAAKGNSARLLDRYRYVLGGLEEAGKITAAQKAEYSKALPVFPEIPLNQRWGGTNGYLMKMVHNELIAKGFTEAQIDGGGLKITTTFDPTLQAKAVEVGQKYKARVGANSSKGAANLHPAIASVRVGTGEVLAIYGGDDYIKNSRNWATTDRPAASTFKAYATVAALRGGLSLRSILRGNTYTPKGDSVEIRNEDRMQYGDVTLRKALALSINTAFVDAVEKIKNGPEAVIKAANDAGVAKGAGWDPNGRIALGIAEVSALENAGGFATFANEGVSVENHVVKQVVDAKGKVLYTGPTSGKQTIEKDVASDVSSALESVTTDGTGARAAQLGYPVAGKTGTNGIERNGKGIITSAWFVAYTKQVSTAILYVAGDDGNQALDDYKRDGDLTFFGGTYPAMTWVDFMETAMDGLPEKSLPDAQNVNRGGDNEGKVYVPVPTRSSNNQNNGNSNNGNSNTGNGNQGNSTSQPTTSAAPTGQATAQASQPAATSGATAKATTQPTSQTTAQQTTKATSQPTARTTTKATATSKPTATTKAQATTRTTTKATSQPTAKATGN